MRDLFPQLVASVHSRNLDAYLGTVVVPLHIGTNCATTYSKGTHTIYLRPPNIARSLQARFP